MVAPKSQKSTCLEIALFFNFKKKPLLTYFLIYYYYFFPPLQVVQSLKFQSSSKTYAELGSCPALNSGTRPLLARGLTDGNTNDGSLHEEWLQTSKGKILVTRQGGDTRKPTLITYHDIGLNGNSNFIVSFEEVFYENTFCKRHCYFEKSCLALGLFIDYLIC